MITPPAALFLESPTEAHAERRKEGREGEGKDSSKSEWRKRDKDEKEERDRERRRERDRDAIKAGYLGRQKTNPATWVKNWFVLSGVNLNWHKTREVRPPSPSPLPSHALTDHLCFKSPIASLVSSSWSFATRGCAPSILACSRSVRTPLHARVGCMGLSYGPALSVTPTQIHSLLAASKEDMDAWLEAIAFVRSPFTISCVMPKF